MPLLTLSLSETLDKNTLDKISDSLTSVTQRALGKESSVTRVDINTASTYLAGKPTNGFTFSLTISITQDTNSAEQCQLWLQAANHVMSKFGASADESVNYLSIITLPPIQWGYNGLSQESRKLGI